MLGPMIDKYAAPKNAYALACTLSPWFAWISILLFIGGIYGGLVYAPPDYDQGESFRIIYVYPKRLLKVIKTYR